MFAPEPSFAWTAGQFIRVGLPHTNPDSEGPRRYFTIASAPAQGFVQISTRLTGSSFKQALANLPIGGQLELLDAPAGDFTWQPSSHPLIFVAQGIGVTPFISQLRQRHLERTPLAAHLLYGNRSPDIPFTTELQNLASTHPEFNLTISDQPISLEQLGQIPHLSQSLVYISGPIPTLGLLRAPFNLPISRLKQDTFPNYPADSY